MKTLRYILLLLVTSLSLSFTAFCLVPEIVGEASVRAETPVGFRVKAAMSLELSERSGTSEYGFLVTRKIFLENLGLTIDGFKASCKADFIKGIARGMDNGEFIDRFLEKNDTQLFFTGHMYGISPYYYTEVFVLRPYVIYEGLYYYGDPFEVSIYNTAKSIKDSAVFADLSDEQKEFINSVIIHVDGEPYELCEDDMQIVLSSKVIKNQNPTYSVSYTLLSPYTGEITENAKGRTTSKNISEIEEKLLLPGTLVPYYNGVVQDKTEGYADTSINLSQFRWISSASFDEISLVEMGLSIECKECLSEYVSGEGEETFDILSDVPVIVMNGGFADGSFSSSTLEAVIEKDKTVLCRYDDGEQVKYADFVRAYVFADDNKNVKSILVHVTEDETLVKDTTCLKHSFFDVVFMVDGKEYSTASLRYGSFPETPEPPEKQGYIFKGWSESEGGEIVNPALLPLVEDAVYHAVFEEIVQKENDPVLLEILGRGLSQLKKIRLTANSKADTARDLIVECIGYVLADAENGNYIDKNYILNAYPGYVEEIKTIIKEKMTPEERSAFVNVLKNERNIDKDVQDFLIEYFNIDLSVI